MQPPNSAPSRPPVTIWLIGPKPLSPNRPPIWSSRRRESGEVAGEQVEAAAHQPPAEQRDEDAGAAAGKAGDGNAAPKRARRVAAREPGAKADRAAEQHAFGRPGDVARRAAEQEVERVEAEQLDERADDQPAGAPPAMLHGRRAARARRGDAEADAGAADQRHQRWSARAAPAAPRPRPCPAASGCEAPAKP